MNRIASPFPKWPLALAAAAAAALVTGLAFAGWMRHGSDLLLGLAESGLSWCL